MAAIGEQISNLSGARTCRPVRRKRMLLCMLALLGYCKVSSDCITIDPSCNAAASAVLFASLSPHDNAGILQWTRLLGVAGVVTEAHAVTTDTAGNIYVTGFTDGNLGGQTLTGIRDLFLTKYDNSGRLIWTRLLGVAAVDSWGFGIRVDGSGNIFLTGGTSGNLDGQVKTGTPYDVHLIKYDAGGNRQWTRLLGVAAVATEGFGLTLDQAGNAYITGYTDGNLDGQVRTGTRDQFIVKYDTNGNRQWTRLLGVAAAQTFSYSITTDATGNLFVAGQTTGALDGQSLTGTQDMFLARYDLNGSRMWTRLLGAAGVPTVARAVTTDAGNVYVTGYTDGSLDGQALTGIRDVFLTKYTANGNRVWTRLLGAAPVDSWGFGVTADVLGNLYVTGGTAGNLGQQTKTGTWDMHLIKYDRSGTRQWTRLLGAPAVKAEGFGTEITSDGTLYNVGYTEGDLGGQIRTGSKDLFVNQYR